MDDTPSLSFGTLEPLGDATRYIDRILEIIHHIEMLDDFEREEVAALAPYMRCFRAAPGSELIREGEPGDFMLLVIEGEVEIVKLDPRGLPQRLAIAGPGKTLGEMSLIDGEPRFASCVTLETSILAVLERDAMVRVINEAPKLGVKILMELLLLLNQRLRTVSGELMRCLENQRLRIR